MRLKEKKLLKKFAATLKKLSAQGAKKVDYDYGMPMWLVFDQITSKITCSQTGHSVSFFIRQNIIFTHNARARKLSKLPARRKKPKSLD